MGIPGMPVDGVNGLLCWFLRLPVEIPNDRLPAFLAESGSRQFGCLNEDHPIDRGCSSGIKKRDHHH